MEFDRTPREEKDHNEIKANWDLFMSKQISLDEMTARNNRIKARGEVKVEKIRELPPQVKNAQEIFKGDVKQGTERGCPDDPDGPEWNY